MIPINPCWDTSVRCYYAGMLSSIISYTVISMEGEGPGHCMLGFYLFLFNSDRSAMKLGMAV